MKTASITQTKNQLSAFIDEVKRGGSILILDRGRPVARLVPAAGELEEDNPPGRIDRLERVGAIRRAEQPPARPLRGIHPVKMPTGARVLEALLAEREEGR